MIGAGVCVLGLGLLVKFLRRIFKPTGDKIREKQLRTLTAPTVIFEMHVETDGPYGSRYSWKPTQVEFVLRLESLSEMGRYMFKREPAVVETRRAR